MRPQKRARPGVAARRLQHGGPVDPVDEDWVPRLACVGCNGDRCTAVMGRDQAAYRLGPDERLVGEGDHHGGNAAPLMALRVDGRRAVGERAQPHRERRTHPRRPVGVVHGKRAR